MKELDYLWLFFVIAAGVTTGNLLSNWITTRIAAYELEEAAAVMQQSLTEQKERLEAQTAERHEQTREQRASSALGRTIERACRDWRQAHDQTPTYTTQTETQRHCGRYARYLDTGVAGE